MNEHEPQSASDTPERLADAAAPPTDASTPPIRAAVAASSDEPPDEPLDPELVRLPKPRHRRSPIAALAVLITGAILLHHLRDDFRYALSSQTPVEVHAGAQLATSPLNDNQLTALDGLPDYRNALVLEPVGDQYRRAFFRLLKSGNQLLVRSDQTSTRHTLSECYVGRLRRFDQVPYAEQLRDYYKQLKTTRFLDMAAVRGCLPALAGCATLLDRTGEALRLDTAASLLLVVDFPGELKVALGRDRFAVEEDARHELDRLGQRILRHVETTAQEYIYIVEIRPGERDTFLTRLEPLGARFALHRERISAAAGSVKSQGDNVTFAGSSYPWDHVVSVQLDEPIVIPQHAWVLLEGELPASLRWVPLVAGALVLVMLLNVWLLYRALRPTT